MGFWDRVVNWWNRGRAAGDRARKEAENRRKQTGWDKMTPSQRLQYMKQQNTHSGPNDWAFNEAKAKRQERNKYMKEHTKSDLLSAIFNPKSFTRGIRAFLKDDVDELKSNDDKKEAERLQGQLSKAEFDLLDKIDLSTEEGKAFANAFAKAKMYSIIVNDGLNATNLSNKEIEEIKKKFSQDQQKIMSKEEFKKNMEDSGENTKDLDKKYNNYVNFTKFVNEVYNGNQHLALTQGINKTLTKDKEEIDNLLSNMLQSQGNVDKDQLDKIEQELNDKYNNLIMMGHDEAEMYGFPITQNEIIAHGRYKSEFREMEEIPILGKLGIAHIGSIYGIESPGMERSYAEKINKYNPNNEKSMYTFKQSEIEELNKKDAENYKNRKEYNREDTINQLLFDSSGGLYDPITGAFKSAEDDELVGIKGFNDWRKKGYLTNILEDQDLMEDLAVQYQVIKEKQGEEAAKQWIQERFQHIASEQISGWKQGWNATYGFVKDVLGDAAEIVGGGIGAVGGLTMGVGRTLAAPISGENVGQVWTDAVGLAFDNYLTRWGAQLSSTGYWTPSGQEAAKNAFGGQGFNAQDNIMDPEHADRFIFKGGGSGIGYGLSDIGRNASHTMVSVWASALLGPLSAKGTSMLVRALGGSMAAMKVGYRIGTGIGLALSGMNEGAMDGIQVKDDVIRDGLKALDDEYNKKAVFDYLSSNGIDPTNQKQLAEFLRLNNIGNITDQDENGNEITKSGLFETVVNKDGTTSEQATLKPKEMVDLLANSEIGKQKQQEYLNRPDIIKEKEQLKKDIENRAIRSGAAVFFAENFINGSIRSFNRGARANMKAAEREQRKLRSQISVRGGRVENGKLLGGEVSIANAKIKDIYKNKAINAWHEAFEEGSQSVAQATFTHTGMNSVQRRIQGVYDADTWGNFISDAAMTIGDIVSGAGGAVVDQETYEAAVQGAVGSLMGYADFRRNSNAKLGFTVGWQGSVLNYKRELDKENQARQDIKEALQNSIDKQGGIKTLVSISSTKKALDIYNSAVENDKESEHTNNELAMDAMMHNISTLLYIKDTEFGQNVLAHLGYQADMLGQDFYETSERSADEVDKMRMQKAKEFLTTDVEGEELTKKKESAIIQVQEYLRETNQEVRDMDKIAENPTDSEARALIDIVMTAQQANELLDQMDNVDKTNSRLVKGLDFVAKNELNVKTLLVQNQKKRLKEANARITHIAESSQIQPNGVLTSQQKHSIARLGNTDEARTKSTEQHNKVIESSKKSIKELKKSIKTIKAEIATAKVEKNEAVVQAKGVTLAAAEQMLESHKAIVQNAKENLNKDKRSLLDKVRRKGSESIDLIEEESRVLSAYDILMLNPYERAIMFDSKNEDRYSEEQRKQINDARELLTGENAVYLVQSTNVLQNQITLNSNQINDVITNIDKYNDHVAESQKKFRTSVLNYRYEADVIREMDRREVRSFVNRLEQDVKDGLISEEEKNELINRAITNENNRLDNAEDNEYIKTGWSKYNQIENQSRDIGTVIRDSDSVIDEARYDELMVFLHDQYLTLPEFNSLSYQEKVDLLNKSDIANIEDNQQEIDNYIQFAANTQDIYLKAKQIDQKVNQNTPTGTNDNNAPEERIVNEPEEQTEEQITNPEILQTRLRVDGTRQFGSRINRFINYLKLDNIQKDEEYGPYARNLLDIITNVAKSDTPISSMDQLYDMIDMQIEDPQLRNVWGEVKNQIHQKVLQHNQQMAGHRDTMVAESAFPKRSSATLETQRVSEMRQDVRKKPLVDFLESYNYDEIGKIASKVSQGSSGAGSQIFYVTNSDVTQLYKDNLGKDYNASKHLPVFACVSVSDDYKGNYISITVGNKEFKVVPLAVLPEDTSNGDNISGMDYSQAIRNLALEQPATNGSSAIMVNNSPVASHPQNWTNWIRQRDAQDYTGRRNMMDEIKGFGSSVKSAINNVISKLTVKDVGDKENRIVYDDGGPDSQLIFIRQAGLSELQDETQGRSIADVLGGTGGRLDKAINNKIVGMFYDKITTRDDSLANLLQSKDKLMQMKQTDINQLNERVDKLLAQSFWIAGFNGIDKWKYTIDIDKGTYTDPVTKRQINGKFVLKAVPITNDPKVIKDNEITLLDFSDNFNEKGEINLSIEDANKILYNLIFDNSGEYRTRKSYNSPFAQVQIGRGVVKHANGIFDGKFEKDGTTVDENTFSAEEKKNKQEASHAVLSKLIEGGGLIIEGQIDNPTDYVLLHKPEIFNKDKQVSAGEILTPDQGAAKTMLSQAESPGTIDNVGPNDKRQSLTRDQYIGLNKWRRTKQNEVNPDKKSSVAATKIAGLLSGQYWARKQKQKEKQGENLSDEQRETINKRQEAEKDIRTTKGTNADLILRHVLWTSNFNSNASERESVKKIPINDSDNGDGFYTDQELEQQFGFHAKDVKQLAKAFDGYLMQLSNNQQYTFVTNVVRPRQDIEITDKSTGKKYSVPVSGELDLLAIGPDGMLHPIDFKTMRITNTSIIEDLRSTDKEVRAKAVKNQIGEHTYSEYQRQLNIYQRALEQMGFKGQVGSAMILAVPLHYDLDAEIGIGAQKDYNENSEYQNETLVSIDDKGNKTPLLDGLGLFSGSVNEAGTSTLPVMLTELEIGLPTDENFQFNAEDLLYMAQEDVDFLAKNPELSEVIDEIYANQQQDVTKAEPNRTKIEVKPLKEDNKLADGTQRRSRLVGRKIVPVYQEEESDVANEQAKPNVENLAIGKTRGNFTEVTKHIQHLESQIDFSETNDIIDFVVGDQTYSFTVKQVKDFMASLGNSEQEIKEEFNNMTTKDICDGINCRG